MKANALLAALLFLTPAAGFAGDLWLHPPTKGKADIAPIKAWLEGKTQRIDDPRAFKAPFTPAIQLGHGTWYKSISGPTPSILPQTAGRKPIAKAVDFDAISLVRVKEKPAAAGDLLDDPEFEVLKAKLDALDFELNGPLSENFFEAPDGPRGC